MLKRYILIIVFSLVLIAGASLTYAIINGGSDDEVETVSQSESSTDATTEKKITYVEGTEIEEDTERENLGFTECAEDRACFYESFSGDCNARFSSTTNTIEGDPIVTSASLEKSSDNCKISISIDNTKDKFGNGKIENYTCQDLEQIQGQPLIASTCSGNDEQLSLAL